MGITTVHRLDEVKQGKAAKKNVATKSQQSQLFDYNINSPIDTLNSQKFWSESTKALLRNTTQNMGIKSYTPTILKNVAIAIDKSQQHLIDLIKYYEGDKNNYYESHSNAYNDKYGNITRGFGIVGDSSVTSKNAYKKLCKDLESRSKEIQHLLNKRFGDGTYESLPSSIKEGLIDLCYNKGLSGISNNEKLMNSIRYKNYSSIVKNLPFVHVKKNGVRVEDAGLYRRSLSRLILSARDLYGIDKKIADLEISKFYQKALNYFKKQNIDTNELTAIYEHYKNKPVEFKHSYQDYETKSTTKNVNVSSKARTSKTKDESGFWGKIWSGIKNFFGGLFGSKKEEVVNEIKAGATEENKIKTPFQKMLEKGQVVQDGDFQIISEDYKVKEGDTLWGISKKYGTTVDLLKNDNNMLGNKIKIGQNIKIQKMGYKIQSGDTLTQIAKKFGLSIEILKDINNIEDVNVIKAGQTIEIPGFIYNVQPKDTLSQIAKKVGVDVNFLKKINNLTSDTISPNQKIKIVYNDPDYAISSDKKKVTIDAKTKTKTEIVDMSGTANLSTRSLLKQKRKVNGQVAVTRKTFEPTRAGKLSGRTIIVNAGHGYSQAGTDCGAVGRDGLEDEWLVNYDNSMRLIQKLRANGARVIFMQGHVNLIANELQKKEKADMFISVHVNSNTEQVKDRTQIYTTCGNGGVKDKSKKLSKIMESKFDKWIPAHEKIAEKDKFKVAGKQDYAESKEANYSVIKKAEKFKNAPSVLWEVGFMSSPKGRERMKDIKLMDNYCDLMTQAVLEYFK